MAINYATDEQVLAALRLTTVGDLGDHLSRVIPAASRRIDRYCRRWFGVTTTTESREYARTTSAMVLIHDVPADPVTVETRGSVADSWSTIDADEYQLEPVGNLTAGGEGYWPYTRIRRLGGAVWPSVQDGSTLLRVTGLFGWSSVPDDVTEACVLLSIRSMKRPDAPFGVTYGELGSVSVQRMDPDVMDLLDPYARADGIG